jgi:adenosylcobinamide kinase / adenosylcobinamide-phosphate guanylyltransferase
MLTLVLGGARSGKSRYAQSLCENSSQVVYVATARVEDQEMGERIARHRADRPSEWRTVEQPLDLSRAVCESPVDAVVLIDCMTIWLSNLMWEHRDRSPAEGARRILEEVDAFLETLRWRGGGDVILVSNEVGGGLVPEHPVGRAFRDLQGFANQRLAQAADNVALIIAGLPLKLK